MLKIEYSIEYDDCEDCGFYEIINVVVDFDGIVKTFNGDSHLGHGSLDTEFHSIDNFITIMKEYSIHILTKYEIDMSTLQYITTYCDNDDINITVLYMKNNVIENFSFYYAKYNIEDNYMEDCEYDVFELFCKKENIEYFIKVGE